MRERQQTRWGCWCVTVPLAIWLVSHWNVVASEDKSQEKSPVRAKTVFNDLGIVTTRRLQHWSPALWAEYRKQVNPVKSRSTASLLGGIHRGGGGAVKEDGATDVHEGHWAAVTAKRIGNGKNIGNESLADRLVERGDDDGEEKEGEKGTESSSVSKMETSAVHTGERSERTPVERRRSRSNELLPLPKVQCLLSRRRRLSSGTLFNQALLRQVALTLIMASLNDCLATTGQPYRATIQALLMAPPAEEDEERQSGPLDDFVARLVLCQAARNVLPPVWMPSLRSMAGISLTLTMWLLFSTLLPQWSVDYFVRWNYRRITSLPTVGSDRNDNKREDEEEEEEEEYAVLVELPDSQQLRRQRPETIVCTLHQTSEELLEQPDAAVPDAVTTYYFDLQDCRYYLDPSTGEVYYGGPTFWNDVSLGELQDKIYGDAENEPNPIYYQFSNNRTLAHLHYGPSVSFSQKTAKDSLFQLWQERILSPLVMVQVFMRILSVLGGQEPLFPSGVLRLGVLMIQHFSGARQALLSRREVTADWLQRQEAMDSLSVMRRKDDGKGWMETTASDLIPGDIFFLSGSSSNTTVTSRTSIGMPVDALLLEGTCVMDEAVLTGESTAQSKVSIGHNMNEKDAALDMSQTHRSSVLFAGTTLLQSSPKAVGLVLRTGSYSSRGGGSSVSHPQQRRQSPLQERDGRRLIVSLSVVATVACVSLFIPSSSSAGDTVLPSPSTMLFRRCLLCLRILLQAIPSDLPWFLSTISNSLERQLQYGGYDVVLSRESSSTLLTLASNVTVVVWDKTGTLTADTQRLRQVIVAPGEQSKTTTTQNTTERDQHPMLDVVLAGCHSLVLYPDNQDLLLGDPVDVACFQHSKWKWKKQSGPISGPSPSLAHRSFWQLQTFAFDPLRRRSSALLLARDDNKYSLWAVVKGAPDAVRPLLQPEDANGEKHATGTAGMRTIVLAAREIVWQNSTLAQRLFPDGIDHLAERNKTAVARIIRHAQDLASRSTRRDADVEVVGELALLGWACFDAAVRASSASTIQEITRRAGIQSVMLTGDQVDAAVAVAQEVGILSTQEQPAQTSSVDRKRKKKQNKGKKKHLQSVAVLEAKMEKDGEIQSSKLYWTVQPSKEIGITSESGTVIPFTLESVQDMLNRQALGTCSMVATGDALEVALASPSSSAVDLFLKNLANVGVIARASPPTKQKVVAALQNLGGHSVLMCGDGVNDVAAMKAADVSVAMMNGYGTEEDGVGDGHDVESDKRREAFRRRRGRGHTTNTNTVSSFGVGDSGEARRARVKAKMDQLLLTLQQEDGTDSFKKVKSFFKGTWRILGEEHARGAAVRRGGGAAARIMAAEEKLAASLRKRSSSTAEKSKRKKAQSHGVRESMETDATALASSIRPGEACLAATFTCLRPSIAGVDAILRAGRAAAALSVSMHRQIGLICLMTCVSLAAFYRRSGGRGGTRFSTGMDFVESLALSSLDQAGFTASTQVRPRLSPSTTSTSNIVTPQNNTVVSAAGISAPPSLFHPYIMISTLMQTVVHIATMDVATRFAKKWELDYPPSIHRLHGTWMARKPAQLAKAPLGIRWSDAKIRGLRAVLSPAAATRLQHRDSMVSAAGLASSSSGNSIFSLRRPFRPNYLSNVVFLFSIGQSAVLKLMTHAGKPWYGAVLESRPMVATVAAAMLFCVLCAASDDFMPEFTYGLLELAPWPHRVARAQVFGLLVLDFVLCWSIETLCRRSWRLGRDQLEEGGNFSTSVAKTQTLSATDSSTPVSTVRRKRKISAAEEEEEALRNEEKENRRIAFGMGLLGVRFASGIFLPSR